MGIAMSRANETTGVGTYLQYRLLERRHAQAIRKRFEAARQKQESGQQMLSEAKTFVRLLAMTRT